MELVFSCVAIILLTLHQSLLFHRVNQLDKHIQMLSHLVFECVEEIEDNERKTKAKLNALYGQNVYADTDSVQTVDLNEK